MIFDSESVFEENVITVLKQHGWKNGVLRYPTERDLLDNWKGILYRNNNDIDRLGKYPLTDGEMTQIIEQIETLRTPLALNSFVNGRTVSITRDNKEDVAHFGKEVSLYIYDRKEIAGGKSSQEQDVELAARRPRAPHQWHAIDPYRAQEKWHTSQPSNQSDREICARRCVHRPVPSSTDFCGHEPR